MSYRNISKPSREELKTFMIDKTNQEAASHFKVSVRTIVRLIKSYGLNYEEMKYGNYPLINEKQKELLIASLLGDGGLEKGGRFKLGQTMIGDKKEYVDWLQKELSPYSKEVYKCGPSFRFYTITHSVFKDLRQKWYPAGKKIIPKDIVLSPQILAHWHVQDGTNNQAKKSLILATDCFTKSDTKFLQSRILVDLGLRTTLQMKHGIYPKINIGAYEYQKAIDLISPYIDWRCFDYKVDTAKVKLKNNKNSGACKLNKQSARQIRALFSNKGVKIENLAKRFGVTIKSIYNVLNNETYPENNTAGISVTYNPKET